MAVAGKKGYKLYLTPEAADYISEKMDIKKGSGGLSALVDEMLVSLYHTLKKSGLDEGKKLTWAKLLRILINGLKQ